MGESQAFPWEGKVPSEARRMRSRFQVIHLLRLIPPASTSSGLRATFPSQGKAWGHDSRGIRLITASVNYITRNAFPDQVNYRARPENRFPRKCGKIRKTDNLSCNKKRGIV